MVHRGLDLVLEAFAKNPQYELIVCGPVHDEKDFEKTFHKELYELPNIRTVGWVDVGGTQFAGIAKECVGVIYPTCSEGTSGSVVTCMHAGLVPIISVEAGVDVDGFGVVLKESSIREIEKAIKKLSSSSPGTLKSKARKAWMFARAHYTREQFSEAYCNFVATILKKGGEK